MKLPYSPLAIAAFDRVFLRWMRRRVSAVRMTGLPDGVPQGAPLLLAANHVSWWDGFVLREVQRALRPRAPMYTVMTRRELGRAPFLGALGGVGIDPASPASIPGAIRELRDRLARHPDAVILFFPQGRIWPSHRRPLGFRRGVELFARELGATIVPAGLHMEPLNTVAPSFFVSLGEPVEGRTPVAELERRVEAQLDAILGFLAEHGEDAPARWPPPTGRLPRGAGTAPIAPAAG
jgi:1-acyl-sn-glycerol-3-phosphate acyltransferase